MLKKKIEKNLKKGIWKKMWKKILRNKNIDNKNLYKIDQCDIIFDLPQ